MAEVLAQVHGFPLPDGSHLDLSVHAGEVVRITGPNGSGKTSLLRALAGLEAAVPPHRVLAAHAGFAMQHAMDSLIGLTVNGEFRLRGLPTPNDVAHLGDQDVATLSSGEARHVALAVARSGRLLLLDEPDEGLDTGALQGLQEMVRRHRQHGGVVVADHGGQLAHLADRTVALGDETEAIFPPFEHPGKTVLLEHPGGTVHVDDVALPSPALRLAGGFHALTGRNGQGKSLFLQHLFHPPSRFLPAQAGTVLTGPTVANDLEAADPDVVAALVPAGLLPRHPWALSGGEQQRVALAKVLGRPSTIYLLDEPEAHLDGRGRSALHAVLQQRIREGSCILAASHDARLIGAATTVVPMEAA